MSTLHKDTITLFNRKTGNAGDFWYPTVLHDVHVIMESAEEAAKYGPDAKDTVSISIPYLKNSNGIIVGAKKWLPSKEWAAFEDPSSAITFAGGTSFDFFCIGAWEQEGPAKDADYPDGNFYSYMEGARDYVFAIASVRGPFGVIPHFEIVGR